MENISDEAHAWSLEGVVGGEGESQLKYSHLKDGVGKTADHTVPETDRPGKCVGERRDLSGVFSLPQLQLQQFDL